MRFIHQYCFFLLHFSCHGQCSRSIKYCFILSCNKKLRCGRWGFAGGYFITSGSQKESKSLFVSNWQARNTLWCLLLPYNNITNIADSSSNFVYICYLSLVFRLCCPMPCLLREIGKYFFWLDNFYQPIFIRAQLLFHTIYCNFIQNTRSMQVFFIAGIITLFNIYKAFLQFS